MSETKESLKEEIIKLKESNNFLRESDLSTRTKLSEFLGSFKKQKQYMGIEFDGEVKVLDWAQIYYNLGIELGEKRVMNNVNGVYEDTRVMRQDINYIMQKLSDLDKILNDEDCPDCKNSNEENNRKKDK